MTDLNKVNFMSKTRFDNLALTNDDELYLVETNIAVDEDVVHKTGDESIAGTKTFSNNIVVTGTTTLNNALTVNNNASFTGTASFNNVFLSGVLQFPNNVNNNAVYSNAYIEFRPSTTSSFGGYIDFHYEGSMDDYTARIIESASGDITYVGLQRDVATNSTTSGTLAVKGWVNDPAKATNVVHRSGNEEIGGIKTFTSNTYMQGNDDMSYTVKCVNADNTSETQSVLTQGNFRVVDNNNVIMGDMRVVRSTIGTVTSSLVARNYASDSTNGVTSTISCAVDNEGNVYTSAPTPVVTDNSTQIATTAWVNTKIQFVNALPASPVNGVLYLIPQT